MQGAGLVLMPAVILMIAMMLDWLCGDIRWLFKIIPHPVAIIGKIISFLEKKLNRDHRSEINRTLRGLVVVLFVVGLVTIIAQAIMIGITDLPFSWAIEAFIASILLAGRSLYNHVGAVGIAMKKGGLKKGREAVAHIVGRDPKLLDKHAVIRAAIESLSENFADGVIAPIFWYLLLGLPGLFAYKAINTLDSMIGYKTKRYKAFGLVAARLDDVANWVPARITGVLLIGAAFFTPGANPFRALKVMWKFADKHASPNAGWPEAAMAGAFDLALGGPRQYPGGVKDNVWIGDGRARLMAKDIRKAGILYLIANLITILGLLIYVAPKLIN